MEHLWGADVAEFVNSLASGEDTMEHFDDGGSVVVVSAEGSAMGWTVNPVKGGIGPSATFHYVVPECW